MERSGTAGALAIQLRRSLDTLQAFLIQHLHYTKRLAQVVAEMHSWINRFDPFCQGAILIDQRQIERSPIVVPPELLVMHFQEHLVAHCVDLRLD